MSSTMKTTALTARKLRADVNLGRDDSGDPLMEIQLSHQGATETVTMTGYEIFDLLAITANAGQTILEYLVESKLDQSTPDYFNLLSILMEQLAELRDPRVRIGNGRLVR